VKRLVSSAAVAIALAMLAGLWQFEEQQGHDLH
jgi:hypothetical protein